MTNDDVILMSTNKGSSNRVNFDQSNYTIHIYNVPTSS